MKPKKKSMTQLRDTALAEVKTTDDRRNRMSKLLEQVSSLMAESVLNFWLDQARWDTYVELVGATVGDGWDEDVHPYLEQKFPRWKTMYGCLQTREEEECPIGTNETLAFNDAVVMFDASSVKTCDVVIRVKGPIFEVVIYTAENWHVEGRCNSAKDLQAMLKDADIRMAKS
jgi:hypothetical protein